jgi:hypothetical protein
VVPACRKRYPRGEPLALVRARTPAWVPCHPGYDDPWWEATAEDGERFWHAVWAWSLRCCLRLRLIWLTVAGSASTGGEPVEVTTEEVLPEPLEERLPVFACAP